MRSVFKASVIGAALILVSVAGQPALAERDPGVTSDQDCAPDDRIGDLSPRDVRGTTFTGTYVGDLGVGSLAGRSDMRTFWEVDRVYAGGPLPEDLQFMTPECGWTNLTPGVRYLFSTAATDIADTPETSRAPRGEPAVTDSLAWELLDTGAVRLAPFDTYDIEDYGPAARSIATLDAALRAVASDARDGTKPAPAVTVDFGCTTWPNPTFDDVRGTTFIGRYIGDEKLGPGIGQPDDIRVYWSVERVYAGGPLPEIVTLRTSGCGPVTLKPGKRYLFTTANVLGPSISNSMAWQIRKNDRVTARPFRSITMDFYRDFMPDVRTAMREMWTVGDVLAAVAPDAGEGEVPMRAADRTSG